MIAARLMRGVPGLLVASLLSWPTGCVLDRPAGAYDYDSGSSDDSSPLVVSDAGSDAPNITVPRNDGAQTRPVSDSAVGAPLAVLDGHRFLMRTDSYSTATSSTVAGALNLSVQLSNLMLVDFNLQPDGSLIATETFCSRHYTTKCTKGCPSADSWQTKLYATVPSKFMRRVRRSYRINEKGLLEAGPGAHALGFDPDVSDPLVGPDATTVVPTSTNGAWSVGSAKQYALYGMATEIDAQVNTTVFGAPVAVTCYLMSAELLDFTFAGAFDASSASSLESLGGAPPFRADMTAWQVESIGVTGDPTYCTSDQLNKTNSSSDAVNSVRFAQADDAAGCPNGGDLAAAYEAVFPGNATAPTTFR